MIIQQLQLLEKLVQIYSWHRECCNGVRDIALQTPLQFREKFGRIEYWLKKSKPDEPEPAARQELDDLCYLVYEVTLCSDPMRELILSEPLLSQANIHEVADYASIADVSPDSNPAVMLNSKDALFMKLLGRILKQFPSAPEDIFRENLSALIAVHMEYPDILEQFYLLAKLYDWSSIIRSIQGYFSTDNIAADKIERLPEPAQTIIHTIADYENKEREKRKAEANTADQVEIPNQDTNLTQRQSKPSVREFLFGQSETTTIQREEVILFQQVEANLAEIEKSLYQESWKDFSTKQKSDAMARGLLEQKVFSEETLQPIKDRIARRMEAAKHYVELREYVKFNALNHSWPELSSELINNRARFLAFESRMLDIETLADEAKGEGELARLLQRYKDNDQLLHFLQLRPYFSGLNLQKAKEIFSLTVSLPQSEVVKEKSEKVSAQNVSAQQSDVGVSTVSPGILGADIHHNLMITIVQEEIENIQSDEKKYSVRAKMLDSSLGEAVSHIVIRRQQMLSFLDSIQNMFRYRAGYDDVRSPESSESSFRLQSQSLPKKLLSAYLKEIGARLNSIFFADEVALLIRNALSQFSKIRFTLQLQDPELWILPWECLYISEFRLPLALISKHSLVRYLPSTSMPVPSMWSTKLRILVIFSNPIEMAPLKLEEEEKVLMEVFQNVNTVEIRQIQHISIGQLQREIRNFEPHIIHFSGHGGFHSPTGEGALIFEDEFATGKAQLILASQFSTACRDTNISLIMLNACDTGVSDINDAVTSVAGTLVADGVPAVIAATRVIEDIQSIIFVREFYRAMVDGYAIEAALAEARKRIHNQEGDWAAFALFANTLDLEQYKLAIRQK